MKLSFSVSPLYRVAALMGILLGMHPQTVAAQGTTDVVAHIVEHLADGYGWHITTLHGHAVTIPLPVILYKPGEGISVFLSSKLMDAHHQPVIYKGYKLVDNRIEAVDGKRVYDFSITKVGASLLLSMLLLALMLWGLARQYRYGKGPQGWGTLVALFIDLIKDRIAVPVFGKKKAYAHLPYLLTLFFIVFLNNLMGLLPGAANVTGNPTVIGSLVLFVLGTTLWHSNRHYWVHIFNPPGMPKFLLPVLVPIELFSLIMLKPLIMGVRLLANITIGHVMILGILSLVFISQKLWVGGLTLPLACFINLLEIFVAYLQAYFFTLFAALPLGAATQTHHHIPKNPLQSPDLL